MGIIRKTASISTLGLISFRSKKERIRRAEAAHQAASDELVVEQAARTAADRRVAEAERRAHQAELEALHEAKVARRKGRKLQEVKAGRSRRSRRKAARKARHAETTVRESVSGLVSAAQPVLEAGAKQARRHGRAARRRAAAAAAQVAPRVEDAADKARSKAADLAARARDSIDA